MPSLDGERLEPIRAAGATGEAAALLAAEPLMAQVPAVDALARAEPVILGSRGDLKRAYPELAARADRAVGAVAALPLLVEGQPTGVLLLVFRDARRFGDEDRALLATLARLCAQALGRATRYEAQHRLAEALQRSLLPTALPAVRDIEIAVRYQPAEGLDVGGDWYEAMALPGDRVGVAVGDVVGRGAAAAAAMGQLRSALRAFALWGESPAHVLDQLSRFAEGVDGGRVATVAYVVIDPATGDARYSLAGHPPPLVVSAEGEARFLEEARSAPLAALPGVTHVEAERHIPPGATLLLYSDGAVERRGAAIDDGLALLARHAAEAVLAGLGPEALCSRLLERLFADRPASDDVALLAVRLAHRPPELLRLRRAARADELPGLRAELRDWLRRAGAGDQAVHDVVLSCGEAVANVIEHAYGSRRGTVTVELEQDAGGDVVVTVRDEGRWRTPRTDPGSRRRGFLLMRRLMDLVEVSRGGDGTTVVMRRGLGRSAAQGAPPPEAAPATARGPARATVTIEARSGHGVAHVSGEVDRSNAARVAGHLREAIPAEDGGVVVDLTGLAYMDSAGALALTELGDLLRERGQRLLLAVPENAPIRRLLEISGVERIAAVAASVSAALAATEG
jgi:anti-anti-sigma factor